MADNKELKTMRTGRLLDVLMTDTDTTTGVTTDSTDLLQLALEDAVLSQDD